MWLKALLMALLFLVTNPCVAQEDSPTPNSDWQKRTDLREGGLRACESFRQSLLRERTEGATRRELVAAAIERFPELCQASLRGRPDLKNFSVSSQDFLRQITGQGSIDGKVAFGGFTGRWYGLWDKMSVDHDWRPVSLYDPSIKIAGDLPRIAALQYSWIGDGFCWNYVAEIGGRRSSHVILGMCYHLDNESKIRLRRPHVGYCAGQGKLIGVTSKEIFFEEVLPREGDHGLAYAITGFVYQIRAGELTNNGNAFQAIYTRQADQRPPWHRFRVDLRVGTK